MVDESAKKEHKLVAKHARNALMNQTKKKKRKQSRSSGLYA